MDERRRDRADQAIHEMMDASRESYRAVVEQAFAARESNERLTRSFFEDSLEVLQDHAELNRQTLRRISEQARRQREVLRDLSRESGDAYEGFVDSLAAYEREVRGTRGASDD